MEERGGETMGCPACKGEFTDLGLARGRRNSGGTQSTVKRVLQKKA